MTQQSSADPQSSLQSEVQIAGEPTCDCEKKMREKPYFKAFACNRCGAQYEMQRVVGRPSGMKCSHTNTYKLTEASRRCHDCGAKILL